MTESEDKRASLSTKTGLNSEPFTLCYSNETAYERMYEQIFNNGIYSFEPDNDAPFIIDGGSNIGVSALYFKQLHPSARVLCFEPCNVIYELLTENIKRNNHEDIELINAALWSEQGTGVLYGEVDYKYLDNRACSLLPHWGQQRATSGEVMVDTVKLSSYIDRPVDFMKLNIEGAEGVVLNELGLRLLLVKEMVIEVHMCASRKDNDIDLMVSDLRSIGFDVSFYKKDTDVIFPIETQDWCKREQPQLYMLRAKNLVPSEKVTQVALAHSE